MKRAFAPIVFAAALAANCAHAPTSHALPTTSVDDFRELLNWATMQAEHRVKIDFEQLDGSHQTRVIQGLIAIQRPNKLRLRALAPGGITLFDVIVVGDHIWIVKAVTTKDETLRALLRSIGDDLHMVYQLWPTTNDQKLVYSGTRATITDRVRKIVLEDFRSVDGRPIFTKAHIENRAFKYRVDIEVTSAKLNVNFPPEMFRVE